MITEQEQEQASLYALGALREEERREFELALRTRAELAEFVRGLQRTTDCLALAVPLLEPGKMVRDRVLDRIKSGAKQPGLSPGFYFHGANDPRGWKELPVRGAWVKLLSIEKARGYAVLLGRLEPGVRYPAHAHAGAEELYILTGDLIVGDQRLNAGDFHHSDAGTSHGVNYSEAGCTLMAVVPADHELVQFALAK